MSTGECMESCLKIIKHFEQADKRPSPIADGANLSEVYTQGTLSGSIELSRNAVKCPRQNIKRQTAPERQRNQILEVTQPPEKGIEATRTIDLQAKPSLMLQRLVGCSWHLVGWLWVCRTTERLRPPIQGHAYKPKSSNDNSINADSAIVKATLLVSLLPENEAVLF